MGVSRQAIYRTVRELQALDVLRLEDDPERGNQKLVVMTERGFRLVAQARAALGEIEATLDKRIGAAAVRGLREALENDWGAAPSPDAE
jgi:DNA-binding MarR family transcriptional regulator